MQRLLNTSEAAPLIGVTAKTAQNWRCIGFGPKFIRAGRRVVYDVADIEAWKDRRRVGSTSQPVAA
jgi:DNA-binding transcriptional MerR regulator